MHPRGIFRLGRFKKKRFLFKSFIFKSLNFEWVFSETANDLGICSASLKLVFQLELVADKMATRRTRKRVKRSRRAAPKVDPDSHRRRRWLLFKNNMRVAPLYAGSRGVLRKQGSPRAFCLNYREVSDFEIPPALVRDESDEPLRFSVRASLFDLKQRRFSYKSRKVGDTICKDI